MKKTFYYFLDECKERLKMAASGFPFPDYIFVACVWRCKWRLMKASLGNLHHVILLLKTVFPFRMSHHCFLVFVCISFCFKWFTLPATAVWVSISSLAFVGYTCPGLPLLHILQPWRCSLLWILAIDDCCDTLPVLWSILLLSSSSIFLIYYLLKNVTT